MKHCKKVGRKIEDLSQYLGRDCLELTGVLPTKEVSCSDLVCSIGKEMGIKLQDEDISMAHRLPTAVFGMSFTERGKQSLAKKLVKLAHEGIFLKTQRRNYLFPSH